MTENVEFDPARSAAIRNLIVTTVSRGRHPARPRLHTGFVIGAVAFGSLASVGAAAVVASTNGWIAMPSSTPGGQASYAPIPDWPVNANGQTYGMLGDSPVPPDLIRVQGSDAEGNAVEGYVLSSDLEQPMPTSPAEALRMQAEREKKYPNGREVPLYRSDGETVIGSFPAG